MIQPKRPRNSRLVVGPAAQRKLRGAISTFIEPVEPRLLFVTYAVTTVADAGAGSLRQAILDANASPGADAIVFSIADGGTGVVKTIRPASQLPNIAEAVNLDATTQPGYTGSPVVELFGPRVTGMNPGWSWDPTGLFVTGSGSVIRGLAVEGFLRQVRLDGPGNIVRGSYLGIDAAGVNRTNDVTPASEQTIGVFVLGADCIVGGTSSGDGNVISGNRWGVEAAGARYIVQGNLIGTDPAGVGARPNQMGVRAFGTDGLIGGPLAAARNVISGNSFAGIDMSSGSAAGLRIQGNYVGTDRSGLVALPNRFGIDLALGAHRVGGPSVAERNVVSGNTEAGIRLDQSDGSLIEGNYIGLAADGSALGNGGAGVWLGETKSVRVGGPGPAANVIAHNGGIGVALGPLYGYYRYDGPAAGNTITQNSIHSNGTLGIDLELDGVSGRDPLDTDLGPNQTQNAPVVEAVAQGSGAGAVATVRLSGAPSASYRIELFASALADASGAGEGQMFLTAATLSTAANGEGSSDVLLPAFPAGWVISATATAADGNTSEFSNALAIGGTPPTAELPSPSNPDLVAASDSGISSTDNITNDATPTFTGLAVPNSTIHLVVNDIEVATAPVAADGTYSITPAAPLADGTGKIVRAYVTTGSATSRLSAVTAIDTDTTAPVPFYSVQFTTTGPLKAVAINIATHGLQPGGVTLTLNGTSVLPAGYAPTVSSGQIRLENLETLTRMTGTYVVDVLPGAVTDAAGNPTPGGSKAIGVSVPLPAVSVTSSKPTAVEGGAAGQFTFTRTDSALTPLSEPLTVNVASGQAGASNPATPGADFTDLPTSVTFPAGAATVTLDLVAVADSVYDQGEAVVLRVLAGADNSVVTPSLATVHIHDPTPPVSATIDPFPIQQTVLDSMTFRLSRPITNLPAEAIVVIGGSSPGPLMSPATLTSSDGGAVWTINGLSVQTATPDFYRIHLVAGTRVMGTDGKEALLGDASVDFNILRPTNLTLTPVFPSQPPGAPVDVVGLSANNPFPPLTVSDFVLTRDGGANLLAGASSVQITSDPYALTGLASLTTASGTYRLTLRQGNPPTSDGLGGVVRLAADAVWTVLPPSPPPPPPSALVLRSPADAHVRNGTLSSQNFGTAGVLEVRKSSTAGNQREAYLRFNLSQVGAATQITSAKVRVFGKLSAAGSVPVEIFSVASGSWTESGIKWSSKPAAGTSPLASRTVSSTAGAWFEFDVTNYLKQRKQAGATGVNFALKATANTTPWAAFNSDEASGNRPELMVVQGPPPPPPQAIVLSKSSATVGEGGTSTLTVKLAAQPASNVVVNVNRTAGDADLTAGPAALTFTPGNWNVAQTVTLAAAQDADATNGVGTFTFSSIGLTAKTLTATEIDNDVSKVLRATADSYVRDGSSAGSNFGTAATLAVRKASTAGNTRWTVLKFSLTSVTTISSATLRLFGKLDSTANPSVQVQAFAASSTSWTETGVTWNNKPVASGSSLGQVSVAGTTGKWYTLDLTAWLRAQKAAGKTVAALVLTSPTATTSMAVFNSDEATANRPELVVKP